MFVETTQPCPKCGAPVVLRCSKRPAIFNGVYSSVLILEHPDVIGCAACGALLAAEIAAVPQIALRGREVEPEAAGRMVVAIGELPRGFALDPSKQS